MNREIYVHVEFHGETLPVGQLWSRSRRGRESASFRYYDFKSRQYWVTTHVRRKAIGKTSLDNDSWGSLLDPERFAGTTTACCPAIGRAGYAFSYISLPSVKRNHPLATR